MPRKAFPLRSSRERLLLCADFLAQNSVLIRYGTKHNAKGGSYFCRLQLLFSFFTILLANRRSTYILKNLCQCTLAACMTSHNICVAFLCFCNCTAYHLVRYGIRKQDQQIWSAICSLRFADILCKYFRFTLIPFTYFFILADHTVMSADDNNAHNVASF